MKKRRHVVALDGKPCWCGSGHDWSLAKHGFCECVRDDCDEVHRYPAGSNPTRAT